jgi:hypothetical protein
VILSGVTGVNLQATLASCTFGFEEVRPHHPITCNDTLRYDGDTFSCPHSTVPVDEQRTDAAVNHTIALLLLELASRL